MALLKILSNQTFRFTFFCHKHAFKSITDSKRLYSAIVTNNRPFASHVCKRNDALHYNYSFHLFGKNKNNLIIISKCWLSTPNKRHIFTWRSIIYSGIIIALGLAVFVYFRNEKLLNMEKERRRSVGKASLGGKFDLIDHNGNRCTSQDFIGKWILLYFGFTHCPDICPDEIEKMVKAVDILEKNNKLDPIQPLFITVDPERDTKEAVAGYIKEFSPKLIGLTGSKEAIDSATRAYRVYYSAGPRDQLNDYIVDHTIIMYLINPEGEFVDYYGQTKTTEDIVSGIMLNMDKYKRLKKRFSFGF